MRSEPIRTCAGCGERDGQGALLRLVMGPEGLRLDPLRRAPGRGAYLHRREACWLQFARRRDSVRSLRLAPGRPERERLVAELAAGAGEVAR